MSTSRQKHRTSLVVTRDGTWGTACSKPLSKGFSIGESGTVVLLLTSAGPPFWGGGTLSTLVVGQQRMWDLYRVRASPTPSPRGFSQSTTLLHIVNAT